MLDLNARPHHTTTITNRHGLEVFVRFNGEANGKPLAVVAHGLLDVHDSVTLRAITSVLIESGHNVLTWDATHSWGRSGGRLREATLTAAYQDMADVVAWARAQPWYQESFILAGHSLGAAASLMFATEEPERVRRLILVAPVVAGKLSAQQINWAIRLAWRITRRLPQPGSWRNFFGYNLLKDGLRYDGRLLAPNLRLPTVIIVGENDPITPGDNATLLFQAIPADQRHLMLVPGADHGFNDSIGDLESAIRAALWLT